jgi:hypothetical protein
MSTSIFNFDHGQKKLNKAIGVDEKYLFDLAIQVTETVKENLLTKEKKIVDTFSPSILVEQCLHNFSYNQLVILASFYVRDKVEQFLEMVNEKFEKMIEDKTSPKVKVQKMSVNADDLPDHIKKLIVDMMEKNKDGVVNGDSLPQELKDFLDDMTKDKDNEDED